MRRARSARRGCATIGLALVGALALAIAAPAHARGNGRARRVPITEFPRQIIHPLVRDAVREIQRSFDPAPPARRRASNPELETRPEAEPEPTPPAPEAAAVIETPLDEPESQPEPVAIEPGFVAPTPARVPIREAPASHPAPRPALVALIAFAIALVIGAGAWLRRRAPVAPTVEAEPGLDPASSEAKPRLLALDDAIEAARALASGGAPDLALARLAPVLAGPALDATAPDTLDWYAGLLVEAERPAKALEVLEALRRRDPARSLATRIEQLRKRASALTMPRAAPASPFPAAGRYEILAEIGRGGMGVVYRARDTRLDRIVALKRLSHHLRDHPRAVALLLQEARSAARLNHPNIVTVYDVDHEDGAYFITMELMVGQPLDAVIARRGKLTPKAAAWVGQHAAAGLAYAHERRIVHRDVKTANLFITRARSLKIMDFGLAKVVEAVRRRASLIAGTPSYMAPEQAQGIEVDGRADLYALGVTLFELLTGTLPFEDGDPGHHHRNTPPPDPRERTHDVPAAFAELVVQLMAKQPARRPASTSEVAARLAALSGS